MLLTLKPPLHNNISPPNVWPARPSSPYHRSPSAARQPEPPVAVARSRSANAHSPPLGRPQSSSPGSREQAMEASHRNLPPMQMNLPPPERMGQVSQSNSLPPPPSQRQNSEDSMRQWLQAKVEEDRRKQEEERTRQESLRLDQRKIEQAMLRDSLHGGVPPHFVPVIFASLGGGGGGGAQFLQQYIPQAVAPTVAGAPQQQQHQQQQQQQLQASVSNQQDFSQSQNQPQPQSQHGPPGQHHPTSQNVHVHAPQGKQPHPFQSEDPRDSRVISPNPYAAHSTGQASNAPQPSQRPEFSPQISYNRTASMTQPNAAAMSSTPPQPGPLTRINTTDVQTVNSPSTHTSVPASAISGPASGQSRGLPPSAKREIQHQQQQQQHDQHQQSSPSIHFYHWIPPNQSQPNTPAGKSPNTSPHSANPSSHLRSEYQQSPKKRKAQGGHSQAPPPPSQLSETSQPRSQPSSGGSRRNAGHSRNRSGVSHSEQESKPTPARKFINHTDQSGSWTRNGEHEANWSNSSPATTSDISQKHNKKDSDGSSTGWYKGDAQPGHEQSHAERKSSTEDSPRNGVDASEHPAGPSSRNGSAFQQNGYPEGQEELRKNSVTEQRRSVDSGKPIDGSPSSHARPQSASISHG